LIVLPSIEFEWDQEKAQSNRDKHGVSFEEAQTVFDDPLYVDFYDPDHSENENRYIIIGTSSVGNILLVSYTERGDIIRIISARQVTKQELKAYQEG
jgi:uncharacterized DUF497 family protein